MLSGFSKNNSDFFLVEWSPNVDFKVLSKQKCKLSIHLLPWWNDKYKLKDRITGCFAISFENISYVSEKRAVCARSLWKIYLTETG